MSFLRSLSSHCHYPDRNPDNFAPCKGSIKYVDENSAYSISNTIYIPCRVGLVVSMSTSHTISHKFASRPGHTKDHHKNGTNCLPAWHAMH